MLIYVFPVVFDITARNRVYVHNASPNVVYNKEKIHPHPTGGGVQFFK
jgi:hypothetical protein